MKRTAFVVGSVAGLVWATTGAFATASASPAAPHESDQPYDLTTATGVISGSLRFPAKVAQPAVVLIVAGSGPVDRNGNAGTLETSNTYALLADALETRGIASVRYDKRGVGKSASAMTREADLRFETYIDDVVAWITKLRGDRRFRKVALAGHSEGSLIGMVAAQHARLDAYASLCGIATTASEAIRRQLAPRLVATPELARTNERILSSLINGKTVDDVPPELMALYRPSVQPYLISWFRYDPRNEITKVRASTAIIGGTDDLQVPASEAKLLEERAPAATLLIVEGMSHMLKDATGMTPQQQVTTIYKDPNLPVMPQVPDAIAALVAA